MAHSRFTYNIDVNQSAFNENTGDLYKPHFTGRATIHGDGATIHGGNANVGRFQDLAIPSFLVSLSKNHQTSHYSNNNVDVLSDESFERLFDMVSKETKSKAKTMRNIFTKNNHHKTKKH